MNLMNFLCKNQKLKKLFERFVKMENKKTNSYYSQYGYAGYNGKGAYNNEYYCYESDLTEIKAIVFYEWSTLNGTQRHFKNLKELYAFMKQSKIEFPSYAVRSKMVSSNLIYCTCEKGKAALIASDDKNELAEMLENSIKK